MKITKRQLKRIIKEERAKIFKEQARSRESKEGELLGNLAGIIGDLKVIKKELFGLVDPDGEDMGSVYGEELEATIDELDGWMGELNDHFESMDPGGEGRTPTEEESGIPDSQRSVIHNRRPDW
tara:strand:- start:1182 stop:1553 length:372 start_codon:yes stop_codon:yes gene_type:complete